MDGDGDEATFIKQLYGQVTIISGDIAGKKQRNLKSAKTYAKSKIMSTGTNTSHYGIRYVKNKSPSYVTYRAQVNLTTVKPRLLECGYINTMSKDTQYFAQTLRKYPLPKPQTKSSDLLQEKFRRNENKTGKFGPGNKKISSKKSNVRKTASHHVFKSNVVFEYNVQDAQRLSKVEEILPMTTKVEANSDNEIIDYEYNYLNSKPKLSNVDVRYCTGTKRLCTCKRKRNNVVCSRPERSSCFCNVCQARREAPSTSRLSPLEYENRQEQEEEVQLASNNYSEISHGAIEFEKVIKQWTETKLNNNDAVQMQVIEKMAKALGGFSKDERFLPEARHEVVKYLTALNIIDPSIKDKMDYYADDLLNNLATSLKNKIKSPRNIDASIKDNQDKSLNQSNDSKLKIFIKHFINQLPVEKDNIKNNDILDTVVQKFLNILQEHNIKYVNMKDTRSSVQYDEKDYYMNRILSWYNSMPELGQKQQVEIYDNVRHFQDLAKKLSDLSEAIHIKENTDKIKVEIMKWLKNYLNEHNISDADNLKEKLQDKLLKKLVDPKEEKTFYYKGLPEKDWITKEIHSLLEDMNNEIHQNIDLLELVDRLVIGLSYLKEKNNGNLTLHQCENELRSWFKYLNEKHNVYFQEHIEMELKRKILSRIKVLLNHENHKKCYLLKRIMLPTKIILQEINRAVINNSINISQEKLLNLITDIVTLVFEMCLNEKLISKNVYEKVCTVFNSILNLPADDIKALVKSILDQIKSMWKNSAVDHLKADSESQNNRPQINYPSKKVYKSQFITSTPRHSKERFLSNFDADTKDFSILINENIVYKIIENWLNENQLKLKETEKQNIIKSITSEVVFRYNYARAFSKTKTDLDEIEYLKYFIFKVLGNYMDELEINNVMSKVNDLHTTINETIVGPNNFVQSEKKNNENQVSIDVLKNNLVNAFMNLNSYLVDERFKTEYKGKLKEEINKFCSQYFSRFPATPPDTEQLHSNIYNALDNVPKPPPTKSEIDIVTQIKNWIDELCKENNLPNNDNEIKALDLANPLLQNITTVYDNENTLSKTISEWVQNYSKKQKTFINDRYWTHKLLEKLKTIGSFHQEITTSKGTSAHMFTIPAAESFGAQVDESVNQFEDNDEIIAKNLITAEDRELLSRVKDRSLVFDKNVRLQTHFNSDKPKHKLLPDVRVREYQWKSLEETQTSINNLQPDDIDEKTLESLQPHGFDQSAQTTIKEAIEQTQKSRNTLSLDETDKLTPGLRRQYLDHEAGMSFSEGIEQMETIDKLNEPPSAFDYKARTAFTDEFPRRKSNERIESMNPNNFKKTKCKSKTCKLRRHYSSRRIEPFKAVCPNKLTVKSKCLERDVPCSNNCLIKKHRIKYFCKKSENVDLQNCPECFGGYCPFPSCAYFD